MSPFRRTTDSRFQRRPRAVWAALITGGALVVVTVFAVTLPVLGLVGAADGATAGSLDVPVAGIVAALAVGFLVAALLLLLCLRTRNGAFAWILAVGAVVSAILVSLWPLVATALAGVDQAQDIVPYIEMLIRRSIGG